MLIATTISTADSAASGTYCASGAAASTTTSSVSAWIMPATGVRPPVRMLVAVRAIAPVAGMPPKNGATMLAMPCAISSWLGSWRSSICASATRADSSDSMAPSSAIVMVGAMRLRSVDSEMSGHANAGSCLRNAAEARADGLDVEVQQRDDDRGDDQHDDGARKPRQDHAAAAHRVVERAVAHGSGLAAIGALVMVLRLERLAFGGDRLRP